MTSPLAVGMIAPSFVVPKAELALGLHKLKQSGFSVRVHPQCRKRHLYFAGTDEERAQAFFESAQDMTSPVLWCARGGYGVSRVLPLLEKKAATQGIPEKKLLVGYSDSTALLEFVRRHWGWSVLHAPMPGLREFSEMKPVHWKALAHFLRGQNGWKKQKLSFFGALPKSSVTGELTGGNLSVWASLAGTPYALQGRGRILFFEDTDESLYRLDRMVTQLLQSGVFEGARAVVLGTFHHCEDRVSSITLRPKISLRRGLSEIFGEIHERYRIPVAYGLAVGHGGGHLPLPLGAKYRLGSDGVLELLKWDWVIDQNDDS